MLVTYPTVMGLAQPQTVGEQCFESHRVTFCSDVIELAPARHPPPLRGCDPTMRSLPRREPAEGRR